MTAGGGYPGPGPGDAGRRAELLHLLLGRAEHRAGRSGPDRDAAPAVLDVPQHPSECAPAMISVQSRARRVCQDSALCARR